jgi:PAS domain S-box-containing protein
VFVSRSPENRSAAPSWIPTRSTTLKFVLGYALVGTLWILASGWVVHHFVHDRATASWLETLKGWGFVFVTALLLGQVLGQYFKAIRRSAQLLHESEARLRFLSDNLPDGYVYEFQRTAEGHPKFTFISAGVERVHGLTPQEVLNDAFQLYAQITPEQLALNARLEEESARNMTDFEMDVRIRRKDGEYRLLHLRSRPVRNGEGQVRWDGFAIDVTEQTKAVEALLQSEKLMREMEQLAKIGGWDLDPATGEGRWTDGVVQIHELEAGVKPSVELSLSHYVGESRAKIEAALSEAIARGTPYDLELEFCSAKGVRKWVRAICQPVVNAGKVVSLHGSLQDISERISATQTSLESQARLQAALASMNDAVLITDHEGNAIDFNDAFASFYRFSSKADCPKSLADYHSLLEICSEDDWPAPLQDWAVPRALRGETASNIEYHLRRKNSGQEWTGSFSFAPILSPGGAIAGSVVVARDITEIKQAQAALRQSEESFRAMFELASIGIAQAEPFTSKFLLVNNKFVEITGYSEHELLQMRIPDLTHPEDREADSAAFQRVIRGESPSYRMEKRYIRKCGAVAWVNVNMTVIRDSSGRPMQTLATIDDITESRRVAELLRQAQKMEAIGQLAGGVAHDFNNILCAMRIQIELAESAENLPENIRGDLGEIRLAADRAANLTRQLLLFSRNQVIQPRHLDLNEAVSNMAKMLGRIIGEDIQLQLQLSSNPLVINADPGMLDQVLMNLAVNARDAMAHGGTLKIKTANKAFFGRDVSRIFPEASPGHYVILCVSDTGSGMPPEVQARIFEPFFTTKPIGQGTGLGLATVFGIVQQHRGWVTVDSQVGQGTCFQIFLPAVGEPKPANSASEATQTKPPRGTETILLAEDDLRMRMTVRTLLERNGYTVLEASNGKEAVELWQKNREKIQLLFTDLVMPGGMTGKQLLERLHQDAPGLKVIFSSGYNPQVAESQLSLEVGQNFLSKPFTATALLHTVRRCLDGQKPD